MREKFTPAPWKVGEPELTNKGFPTKHPHYEITANGKMVWLAHVLCYSDAHAGTEYEANAHLIASAPDLYAALEYTKAQISLPKPVLEKIEAALLKARGIEKEYRGSLHSGWQW